MYNLMTTIMQENCGIPPKPRKGVSHEINSRVSQVDEQSRASREEFEADDTVFVKVMLRETISPEWTKYPYYLVAEINKPGCEDDARRHPQLLTLRTPEGKLVVSYVGSNKPAREVLGNFFTKVPPKKQEFKKLLEATAPTQT
jgi:hypothetical protein